MVGPAAVKKDALDDAIDPGPKRARFLEGAQSAIYLQERLLRNIFRIVPVPRQTVCHAEHRSVISPLQLIERNTLPVAERFDQPVGGHRTPITRGPAARAGDG